MFILFVLCFSQTLVSVILSKSQTVHCVRSLNSTNPVCSMLVQASFGVSANHVDADEIVVDSLSTTTGNYTLSQPVRVALRKTHSQFEYHLELLGVVNGKPRERAKYLRQVKCRNYRPTQGDGGVSADRCFCCPCQEQRKFLSGVRLGRKRVCPRQLREIPGDPVSTLHNALARRGCSVHCMVFSPSWYAVFSLAPPLLSYEIKISVNHSESVTLDAVHRVRNFSLGQALISGDYAAYPRAISGHKLVIKLRSSRDILNLTMGDLMTDHAMLIPSHHFDLTGFSCNKIGVHAETFKSHSQMCGGFIDECLDSQIEDLIKRGEARLARKLLCGDILFRNLSAICPIHNAHITRVALQLNARDVAVLVGDPAVEVLRIETRPVLGERRLGEVLLTVRNLDDQLPGNYLVTFSDCEGHLTVDATKTFHLKAQETKRVSVVIEAVDELIAEKFRCAVNIYGESERILFFSDFVQVALNNRTERRGRDDHLVHLQTNETQRPPDQWDAEEGDCSTCQTFNVICQLSRGCFAKILSDFVALAVGTGMLLVLFCWGGPLCSLILRGVGNISGLFKMRSNRQAEERQ